MSRVKDKFPRTICWATWYEQLDVIVARGHVDWNAHASPSQTKGRKMSLPLDCWTEAGGLYPMVGIINITFIVPSLFFFPFSSDARCLTGQVWRDVYMGNVN